MNDPIYHYMFPTLILEKHDTNFDTVKSAVESNIFNHITGDGWTGESTGFVTLHLDPVFKLLFQFATEAARDYIARLSIDPNDFDFYIVKSWANIIRNRSIPIHSHADAHLSFVYYVNIPEDVKTPLVFHNNPNRYEPFVGLTRWNSKEWDLLNSGVWSFVPSEGSLMIFPGAMNHTCPRAPDGPDDTGVKDLDGLRRHRVSIAGDIIMTFREKSNKALGLQPIGNWQRF